MSDMKKIIALHEIKKVIMDIVDNKEVYIKCGINLPNMIINLSRGNGQTFLAKFFTEVMDKFGLKEFNNLDKLLEFRLDGSLSQINKMFDEINANAVYTNNFEGIVAVDVTKLCKFINEKQVETFMEGINEISNSTTFIIYVSPDEKIKQIELTKILFEGIDNVIKVNLKPYEIENFVDVIIRDIKERNIDLVSQERVFEIIKNFVVKENISTMKEAKKVFRRLIYFVDYSKEIPTLNMDSLENEFIYSSKKEYWYEKR